MGYWFVWVEAPVLVFERTGVFAYQYTFAKRVGGKAMEFIVYEPPREFAIGTAWAASMGPSSNISSESPGACIVCGATGNSCKGDSTHGEQEATGEEGAGPAYPAAA